MKTIQEIRFPNNVEGQQQSIYRVGFSCDEIRNIAKSGDGWFAIIKNGKIIAEIKESICDIFGESEIDF